MREGVRTAVLLAFTMLLVPLSSSLTNPQSSDSSLTYTTPMASNGDADAWNESPFGDVAVPGGFNQTGYLDYSDVGVLINNKSETSRNIGWAFVAARNIPIEHVLLFDLEGTPTAETINRQQFNTYFADVFRYWLTDNNLTFELNYMVTSKGVPLRVSGGNNKVAFDNELALIGGEYDSNIDQNWWVNHEYGPISGNPVESFSRLKHGFYLITRLTGYTEQTALGLIEKANNSLQGDGTFILDLATNRNGSGYKYWNDNLYTADFWLNETMDRPTHFNQNSTFVTGMSDVIGYASWGSNDGAWGANYLPNPGFENDDAGTATGIQNWDSTNFTLAANESFTWSRDAAAMRAGDYGLLGEVWPDCTNTTSGTGNNTTTTMDCEEFSANGSNGEIVISQVYDFPEELEDHSWYITGYGRKVGDIDGWWQFEITGLDQNGNATGPANISTLRTFRDGFDSRWTRFRLPDNATSMQVDIRIHLNPGTAQGYIHLDSLTLRALRPGFDWVDGSIAETAVSTGGRSFNPATGYGQSLVADLLEDGASATKGYVYEPYLTAVCYPSVLLGAYSLGYNMAESYYMANSLMSWMGVVVGDPKMAAFADELHDIHVVDVRSNGTQTIAVEGGLEVILENLAPGPANGTLEIRDRQGNQLVGSVNLSLPGGDQPGSRIITQVNITSPRSGFVEFVARWVNSTEPGFPERVTDNNQGFLNIFVNSPPTAENAWCHTSLIERGDTFTCAVTASDDDAVVSVDLAWRFHNSSQNSTGNSSDNSSENSTQFGLENWTWTQTGQGGNGEWWGEMSIPVDIGLGTIDLAAIAYDITGTGSQMLIIENAATIINAIPDWYGIHVETVDENDWGGASALPVLADSGLLRGRQVELNACVYDADHDNATEVPIFAASRGVVGGVFYDDNPEQGLYCYTSSWIIPIGGNLASAQLELWGGGQLFNARQIPIRDLSPSLSIDLRNSTNASLSHSGGANEYAWVGVVDGDDPDTASTGDLVIHWPGSLPITLPINIAAGEGGALIELPAASDGLESGNLHLEVYLTGAHGTSAILTEYWSVMLRPPNVHHVGICDSEGVVDTLQREIPVVAIPHIESFRPISSISVQLRQSGWSTDAPTLDLSDEPWFSYPPQGCEGNSTVLGKTSHSPEYRVLVDGTYAGGPAELYVRVTDIDGLSAYRTIPLIIAHAPPEMALISQEEIAKGTPVPISTLVFDPDGLTGIRCTIQFLDEGGVLIAEAEGVPDDSGEIKLLHQTSGYRVGQSISVDVECRDPTGNIGNASLSTPILVIEPLEDTGGEGHTDSGQGASGNLESTGSALVILALLVLIAATSLLWYRGRNRALMVKAVDQQAKAWEDIEKEYAGEDDDLGSSEDRDDSAEGDNLEGSQPDEEEVLDQSHAQAQPIQDEVMESSPLPQKEQIHSMLDDLLD